ncbi:SixA phosphatase family protein [Altericroceibacterium endophyticum]|uniref:Histidine phosphatase family protein n=1 Tax=Altericroceibacterium endophyticum TaxID=1808508 RepID=A0A6I4SZY8_9SPHN|nr:histidine phosphatase family protein [Altericroceibacterium endophyticum]MXO64278.1 histidine phosphatase family protein [Altericroceibacterium endophyticum]
MKLLGLFRHAKSDWDDLSLRDFDRGLNDRGRKGAALMGDHIRQHGIKWDHVIASPAQRVKNTLEAAGLDRHVSWQKSAYLAAPATLMELLQAAPETARTVLLAAHNPGLQDLINELQAPDAENDLSAIAAQKYPTASFAVLELSIENWRSLTDHCGRLVHLARPRDLDPELGPTEFS